MFFDDFILRALAAGVAVAFISGLIGCFVVWKRMAYFGDSLSHSALLGVAFGFATGISSNISMIIIFSAFALMLMWLRHKKFLAMDTLLGILAHASLSLGLIIIELMGRKIDLYSFMFGDILTVTNNDLIWLYSGGAIVFLLLIANWSKLLLITINEDIAKAENINSFYMNLLLMFAMTIVVAVSIRVVGILLITSMLIIPAAAARQVVRTPESMAIIASLLGVLAVFIGIGLSAIIDIPSGPAIVVCSSAIFTILTVFSTFRISKN